jgi:hypothetical protein
MLAVNENRRIYSNSNFAVNDRARGCKSQQELVRYLQLSDRSFDSSGTTRCFYTYRLRC